MLETICDTLVEAYRRNWITSRDGNVSIRHHDRDHFYITPRRTNAQGAAGRIDPYVRKTTRPYNKKEKE
jgi:hypothetical protein